MYEDIVSKTMYRNFPVLFLKKKVCTKEAS